MYFLSCRCVALLCSSNPLSVKCIWHDKHVAVEKINNLHCYSAVYMGMRMYFQRVKKTYRPLTAYTHDSSNGEAGSFSADLDSAEKV